MGRADQTYALLLTEIHCNCQGYAYYYKSYDPTNESPYESHGGGGGGGGFSGGGAGFGNGNGAGGMCHSAVFVTILSIVAVDILLSVPLWSLLLI